MSSSPGSSDRDAHVAAYTPPLERIRHSVNQLTDHGSQKCLDCLHHRDEAMDALAQIESALERIATPARPDGTYNLGRSAVGDMARELLDGAGRYQPREGLYKQTVTKNADLPITEERPRDVGAPGAAT